MTIESFDPSKIPIWTPVEAAQAYGSKMMEFGVASVGSAFALMEKISKAKSPTEVADLVASHTRGQFETFAVQVEEISELMRKQTRDAGARVDKAAKSGADDGVQAVGLGD